MMSTYRKCLVSLSTGSIHDQTMRTKYLAMYISSNLYALVLAQYALGTWTENCAHVVCRCFVLEGPSTASSTAIILPNVARGSNDACRSTSFIRGYILFVLLIFFVAKLSDAEYVRYGGWSRI